MPTVSVNVVLHGCYVYTAPCFATAADGTTMMLPLEGVSKRSLQ
jgi:hypothetical protein